VGVLWLDWSIGTLVVTYCLELFAVGIFSFTKACRLPYTPASEKVLLLATYFVTYWLLVLAELSFCLGTFFAAHPDGMAFLFGTHPLDQLALLGEVARANAAAWSVGCAAFAFYHFPAFRIGVDGLSNSQDAFIWESIKNFGRPILFLFVFLPGGYFIFQREDQFLVMALPFIGLKLVLDLAAAYRNRRRAVRQARPDRAELST
jgi:hypothetical protein